MPPTSPRRGTGRRLAAVLSVTALALILLNSPAANGAFADAKDWAVVPVPAGRSGPGAEDRSAFYLEGTPGTVLEDRLSVVNPADRPLTLELRGTGPWIALGARRLEVPARTRADVPVGVSVPADAGPGDHPAAILATADGRTARVRLTVRVRGAALPALAVENLRVGGDGGGAVIHYALVNRGNTVLVAPRVAIRAEGLFGEVLRRTPDGVPSALPPGGRAPLAERWPGAPRWDLVTVRVTATARGAAPAVGSAGYVPWRWLGPTGVLAGGVCGCAVWLRLRMRMRFRPTTPPHPPGTRKRKLSPRGLRPRTPAGGSAPRPPTPRDPAPEGTPEPVARASSSAGSPAPGSAAARAPGGGPAPGADGTPASAVDAPCTGATSAPARGSAAGSTHVPAPGGLPAPGADGTPTSAADAPRTGATPTPAAGTTPGSAAARAPGGGPAPGAGGTPATAPDTPRPQATPAPAGTPAPGSTRAPAPGGTPAPAPDGTPAPGAAP
ncbi:hypothetical protein ACFP1Z_18570 [Streptomyces gamaensis]|uniref:DUF916 domain-containing protein n=1 Tax=Streptomyces gamaensis TaxID=1763542 RepID=A0ABW0Z0C5_9ACTN